MVVVGGSFTTLNGSGTPGYGLARVDATTGASLPLPVNALIRNGGTQASITSLTSDGTSFYGTGYVFGEHRQPRGHVRGRLGDRLAVWVEDCHGDTYAAWPGDDVVYVAGHPHYCGNVGGFPQTDPWTFYRALAFTQGRDRRPCTRRPVRLPQLRGQPGADAAATGSPTINTGTYTGQGQGPWTVTGNSDYVVYGGEFTQVNSKGQQGLVRFARTGKRARTSRARASAAPRSPSTARSFASGHRAPQLARQLRPRQRDPDLQAVAQRRLAADLHGHGAVVRVWKRPTMGFLDTGLTPGTTYTLPAQASTRSATRADQRPGAVTVAADGRGQPVRAGRARRRCLDVLAAR